MYNPVGRHRPQVPDGPPLEAQEAAAAEPELDLPPQVDGAPPLPLNPEEDEGDEGEDLNAFEQEMPEYPAHDDDSPTWAVYWTRHRNHELWDRANDAAFIDFQEDAGAAVAEGDDYVVPPLFRAENFHAPLLIDGSWNRSKHVSKLISTGFTIKVDITKRGKAPPPLRCKDAAEVAFVDQMVSDGILEEGPVEWTVPHFFIRKPGKLRLIFDGRRLNAAIKKPPKFNMKSHATIQKLVSKFAYHAADDLSNMFFSNKIAEPCRKYFGIRLKDGRILRYTSMPFGFAWSPFIAHIGVDEICKRAIEAGHAVTHYLDDFHYFGMTPAETILGREFVRALLIQAGYVINFDKEQPVSTTCVVLGLHYDLTANTVCAKPGFLQELHRTHVQRKASNALVSLKEIASIVGALVFLNNAFPGSLSYLGSLIAWVAAANGEWRKHYKYEFLAPYVARALSLFEALPPCKIQAANTKPVMLYTDATPTQIGLVLPDRDMAVAISRVNVYEAEALAVAWLLEQPDLPSFACIRIDNAALVYALSKGRSNTPIANYVCSQLLRHRLEGRVLTAKWIPTDLNPADVPSRMLLQPSQLFVSPSRNRQRRQPPGRLQCQGDVHDDTVGLGSVDE